MIASQQAVDAPRRAGNTTFARILTFDDAEAYQEEWDGLVEATGSDIYQTFDWCRIWWKYYGGGRQLRILLFFSGDDLVGVLPAFTERLWLGAVALRVARMLGADHTLTLCNPPILRDHLKACFSIAVDHFLELEKCDTLLIGPLAGPSSNIEQIQESVHHDGRCRAESSIIGDSCNTYFPLPNDFAAYMAGLGKQHRNNCTRKLAQLQKTWPVGFDVVSDAAGVQTEFESFQRLHTEQWKREGKLGHFGDWPHALEFNREMVRTLGVQGKVRFHRILAGGQVVCSQFCYLNGSTNYWRLPARAVGEEWLRYSFGYMGLIKMFEASIAEGHSMVEGGRGHYDYKLHIGGREWPLRTVQFMPSCGCVRSRILLFRAAARILTIGYYKIVFARIAPRVSMLRKSLWPFWIRRDW